MAHHTKNYTVLALDLSLSSSGYAVGIVEDGFLKVATFGHIDTKAYIKSGIGIRLNLIYDEISRLIAEYKPDYVVKEQSFSRNAASTQKIFQVVGITILAAYQHGLEVADIGQSTVKKQIAGNGRATKEEVAERIRQLTGVSTPVNDESDALGILIAYCIQNRGFHIGNIWNDETQRYFKTDTTPPEYFL